MGFQDFTSMFSLARRFFCFFKELFSTITTRCFPPSSEHTQRRGYWGVNTETTCSSLASDVHGMEAFTSRYYISPKPGNQYQSSEVTETTQICERSVPILENSVGENQAIKQQKLEQGRVKQIVKANHLNLPHKLRPDAISSETDLGSSSCKEDRKVYVRQTTASSPSVADMVKRFESRTGQVYVQQTLSPSSSATHSTSVAERVKQFESRTSKMLLRTERKQCSMTESLESISGNWEELQNEELNRQRLGSVEAPQMNLNAQPIMKDDLLPVHQKVRKPLTEVAVHDFDCGAVDVDKLDSQLTKEKENMYKGYRGESQSAKKMREERVVKKRISQAMGPKESENIYKRYSEAESAKKMKVERVVQKRIGQTMAHKEKENVYKRNTEYESAMKMREEKLVQEQIRKIMTPKLKENICRRNTEETESAKKMREEKLVQEQIRKIMTPKLKENICRRNTEETESAKKMKEWRVVQKRIMKTMVPNATTLPKFDRPFFPQKSSKESATHRSSPNLRRKQRSVSNCGACFSPPAKVR